MLEKGGSCIRACIERINHSISTNIYCILRPQVQARTLIIGQAGTSPDTQKQLVETLKSDFYGFNRKILERIL